MTEVKSITSVLLYAVNSVGLQISTDNICHLTNNLQCTMYLIQIPRVGHLSPLFTNNGDILLIKRGLFRGSITFEVGVRVT